MARIELSIAPDYVPSWGLWEGFREVASNARDAEREYNAKAEITYSAGRIKVVNTGCTLSSKALLLGGSTKAGNSDLIGQWGEGLKLALLCLTRAGHAVKVRSGGEVWVPRFDRSERFDGAQVLVVDIAKGRESKARVQVEINGVTPEQWEDLRRNILWLTPEVLEDETGEHVLSAPMYGDVLLDDDQRGRLYVHGVWVETVGELKHGYNFNVDVQMDRDRRMLSEWDRRWKCAQMWEIASTRAGAPAIDRLLDMIEAGDKDSESLQHTHTYSASGREVAAAAAARFVQRHGKEAVPVANLEQAREVEHLGVRGVIVAPAHQKLLATTMGDLSVVHARLSEQIDRRYSWADLTADEQHNVEEALQMVALAGVSVGLADLDIVDFRDRKLLGQYKDGRIILAREVVGEWRECLRVLIHEAAHRDGIDGEKSHVSAIEHTWARLIEALWR